MRNQALLTWYHTSGRNLPWRQGRDPWAILVSEVMAQQTQLSRVVPAWQRFMGRFPTPRHLAEADLAELIELWAGLGYQRRAVNLRKAAIELVSNGWPLDAAGLRSLPGVGPYTSAAVASIAFGEPVPAVDTNLRRVLSRWAGSPLSGAALIAYAEESIEAGSPAKWNQAVMDLGATVCHRNAPRCDVCPVVQWCSDPSVYEPAARQSRYSGSVRQARAAIVKMLAAMGPLIDGDIVARVGLDPVRVEQAIDALLDEGLIVRDGAELSLAA